MNKNPENITLIDQTATNYIRTQRDPDKTYSGHELSHLENVARLTELAGLVAGYCLRDIEISRIAGWFHDFKRSMNETNAESDETLSATAASSFLKEMYRKQLYYATCDERHAIEHAILSNGRPPKFWTDRPDIKQWNLSERIQSTLFVADKMEANGVWVIARRSQFVAGARLRSEEADLPKYGLQPNRDENKTVLLEGALRIAFINPEGIYPPLFKPLTARMYDPQRDFLHGLLAAEGMSIEDYAKLLLETKRLEDPEQPNYLQARKLSVSSTTELAGRLRFVGGLSDEGIQTAKGDLASSAAEGVSYFSSHYKQPLEELVQSWQPQHTKAQLWKKDMLEYVSGEWFNQMRNQHLRQEV